jgi:hypothetical protein
VRQNRALTAAQAKLKEAKEELETSYWHLRRIQEYMPICCRCHKVRTNEEEPASWMRLVDYLEANEILFTHGLCPECYEEELAKLEKTREYKDNQ